MEIDEVVARLTRRYRHILLLSVCMPVAVTAYVKSRAREQFTSHARIAVSAEVPKSAAEGNALVSQVDALATSHNAVAKAIRIAHRSPQTVADHHVSVSVNGQSVVVTVAVTDPDPRVAQRLTNALASEMATTFDQSGVGNVPAVQQSVDKQLLELSNRRAPIATQISQLTGAIRATAA
jgi:uncharacterized protein involved in exopolysaccharide biosynthesis